MQRAGVMRASNNGEESTSQWPRREGSREAKARPDFLMSEAGASKSEAHVAGGVALQGREACQKGGSHDTSGGGGGEEAC